MAGQPGTTITPTSAANDDTSSTRDDRSSKAPCLDAISTTSFSLADLQSLHPSGQPEVHTPIMTGNVDGGLTSVVTVDDMGWHGLSQDTSSKSRALRSSKASPKLAHSITHKLSNAFVNPTVVRRRNLRSRPSIQSLCFESGAISQSRAEVIIVPEANNPSSLNTSGNTSSPTEPSTEKTSVFSDTSEYKSSEMPRAAAPSSMKLTNSPPSLDTPPTKSLTPIPETLATDTPCKSCSQFLEVVDPSCFHAQLASPATLRTH